MMEFHDCLKERMGQYGMALSEKQSEQFDIYYKLLIEWNEKINLTAITAPDEVAVKHIIDSLSAWQETFNSAAKAIDIGTGAGFPGIPLKIMHPKLHLTLLDSLAKRLNFLKEVLVQLNISDVELLHGRAEDIGRDKKYREKFDLVFSRAVAKMSVLSEYALPLVEINGCFIALKGKKYKEEAAEVKNALSILGGRLDKIKPVHLPGLDDIRAVIYTKKIKKTPQLYPRKAGTPEKKPL